MVDYLNAILVCLNPVNLILIIAMVSLGIVFGAIPGLSATLGIALLLPITFGLSSTNILRAASGNLDRRRFRNLHFRRPHRYSRLLFSHRHLFRRLSDDQEGRGRKGTWNRYDSILHRICILNPPGHSAFSNHCKPCT